MNTRIEKLNTELSMIPSTNKKKIGTDGLRNEYYCFHDMSNKIYVKHPGSLWNEFTTMDDINELLSCLTDKAVNEKSLISKINKVVKRGKFDSMDIDDGENPSFLAWTNTVIKQTKVVDEFDNLAELFESLEERVTEYLYQDQKEWESFDNRQQWVYITF
jgi:hypothetical protein